MSRPKRAAAAAAAESDAAAVMPVHVEKRARKSRGAAAASSAAAGGGGHAIVDSATWEAARRALLEEEKALSRARAALAAKRAALPWTPVSEDYELRGAGGAPVRLSALFKSDEDTLLVYHMMYGPDDAAPCSLCSFFVDQYDGVRAHLEPRATIVVVAKAPPAKLAKLARAKRWSIPLLSCADSSFAEDSGVAFTPAQLAAGDCPYNFGRQWGWGPAAPGLTVFARAGGRVYKTYATFSAGLGDASLVHALLDLTPTGRGEDVKGNMWWVKHKEEY